MLHVELLDRRVHDRKSFSCGVDSLDHYFRTQAAQDMAKHVAVCYVLVDEEKPEDVAGFYTLSNLSVELDSIPSHKTKLFPKYPQVPAILIGRLAVGRQFQGGGRGEFLLVDALMRALASSTVTGAAVVIVDAKSQAGCDFYRRYGFESFTGITDRLFIPMATLEKLK